MNKLQFLKAVREKTSDLPLHETNHLLEYYAEMIEEAIEEGASEEEAVARLGSWEEICTQIDDFLTSQPIAECPAVKEQTKKEEPINPQKMPRKRISLPMLAVVLLILTSPVWGAVVLSLGIAVFAVVVSLVM
ncbi:MAG: DUF1700 domain-containing protein, partial [Clostridia bacterium]|nr:DUF1700 domain-containing protein [Clostridia bacterium]